MTSFTGGLSSPFNAGLTVLDSTALLTTKPLAKQEKWKKTYLNTKTKSVYFETFITHLFFGRRKYRNILSPFIEKPQYRCFCAGVSDVEVSRETEKVASN